jgi:hypothetical protein
MLRSTKSDVLIHPLSCDYDKEFIVSLYINAIFAIIYNVAVRCTGNKSNVKMVLAKGINSHD